MHRNRKWQEDICEETQEEIKLGFRELLTSPTKDELETERVRLILQAKADDPIPSDYLEGVEDWEEVPERKKTVVTLPKVYYDNLAKKRKKRNKTAAKSRKANRGK